MADAPASVEAYLAAQPAEAGAVLERIRAIVHEVVPGATERISYGMPTFDVDDVAVVHVAGWKAHVSLYPTPSAPADLVAELAPYSSGRGTTKFPLSEPLPEDLVRRMVAALAADRSG